MHTTRIEALTGNLPVKVEFIESLQKVEEILPKLREMVGTGLMEVQDTTVVKPSEVSQKAALQPSAPAQRREGKAKLMRIFIGENDKWHDKPLYKALIESMRANDVAGVTIYQGILGYGANRRIHKDSALHLSHDRPMMLSVVDTEDRPGSALSSPFSIPWCYRGLWSSPTWMSLSTPTTTRAKSGARRRANEAPGKGQDVANPFWRERQMERQTSLPRYRREVS